MEATSPPVRSQTAPPPAQSHDETYYYEAYEPSQEEALEFHKRAIEAERQLQARQLQEQSNTGPEKTTGEKVLDNSIKAANWLIWGDVGGKEVREQKKREKKEKKRKKKEGIDDSEDEEKDKKSKKKKEGEESELKKRKRDDDGVEDDWLVEILQVIV